MLSLKQFYCDWGIETANVFKENTLFKLNLNLFYLEAMKNVVGHFVKKFSLSTGNY